MAEGTAPSDGQFHGGFPSNLGQNSNAPEIQSTEALQDVHGNEEHKLAIDRPPSSSTKSRGKAIQAYGEEHDGAAFSTKFIPKANADNMTLIDTEDPLKFTPIPKKNQLPQILSYLNETRDHSASRDEGREHDPRASNYGHDDNTQTGESSTNGSTVVVQDGISSPCAAELAKATTAAPSSMKSVTQVDPSTEENDNSLGGPSSSMPSPTKAVQDAPGSEEHMLVIDRPPSSSTESRGKAIQVYGQEHNEPASSTKIIPQTIAAAACLVPMQPDAGPSVRAPAQHRDGGVAAIGGPVHPSASDVTSDASDVASTTAQHDVNVSICVGGGGDRPAPAQPIVAPPIPAPAQINDVAVIVARLAPAQLNVVPPVPVLPPNPGLHNIDEGLTNSGIRPLRNPTDGDEGKIWD